MWWKYLISPTISVIISSLIVSGIIFWFTKKKEKKNFLFDIKALCIELEGNNCKERKMGIPFQTSRLEKILDSDLFRNKYPEIFEKAVNVYK